MARIKIGIDGKVILSIWETNPKKRNENNVIIVNAINKVDISKGDEIYINRGGKGVSIYTVLDCIEVRRSRVRGRRLHVLKTSWRLLKLNKGGYE